MSRRRFRVHYSSDEEEEEEEEETLINQNPNPSATNPSPPPPPPPPPSVDSPFEISDEDFVDVPEDFSPPPPPPARNDHHSNQGFTAAAAQTNPIFSSSDTSECPIDGFLSNLGLKLRREWLDSCISGLTNSVPGFASVNVAEKAKLCFEQFLFSDMNSSGGGVLPENVHDMHLVDLQGPFILQVDEIVNIGCPLRDRYQNAASGIKRCLKLSMTDGVQRVFGMEYRPIKDLKVLASAGFKVVIHNVNIRRGLLMLVPEVFEVLGGMVEDLEGARQRLVNEVNKPPRGKRTRNGAVPSLASRATLAAWTSNGNLGHSNSSTSQTAMPSQSSDQAPNVPPGTGSRERIIEESDVPYTFGHINNNGHARSSISQSAMPSQSANQAPNVPPGTGSRERIIEESDVPYTFDHINNNGHARSSISQNAMPSQSANQASPCVPAGIGTPEILVEESDVTFATNVEHNRASNAAASVEEINIRDATAGMPVIDTMDMVTEEFAEPLRTASAEPNPSTETVSDVGEIDMVDVLEHPHILTADREVPFTYLASIFTNWAMKKDITPYIQGKIKCFVTGVKGFQFKHRPVYDLHVYVDDGSLISEVLMDPNYVQKLVGHSSVEVTAALTSSDTSAASHMKETMLKFQGFLVNFEGTMLVEMNTSSSLPIGLEMNQGCSSSDAWSLLNRLETITSLQTPQTPQHQYPEPINISP